MNTRSKGFIPVFVSLSLCILNVKNKEGRKTKYVVVTENLSKKTTLLIHEA
jgi:hypothetical protein